jgi:ribosomal protein L30/L7E
MSSAKNCGVTLVRGLMGKPQHRDMVRGWGSAGGATPSRVADTPQTRGMIGKIGYMLKVTEAEGLRTATMRMNTIKPAAGGSLQKAGAASGAASGSGLGKTAGRETRP